MAEALGWAALSLSVERRNTRRRVESSSKFAISSRCIDNFEMKLRSISQLSSSNLPQPKLLAKADPEESKEPSSDAARSVAARVGTAGSRCLALAGRGGGVRTAQRLLALLSRDFSN